MNLTFCGAARSVTGSCYLLTTDVAKVLVDCGLFQERAFEGRNWEPFPFKPSELDAVLLTHAHIDHIGRLPLLIKGGFKGKILATPATADLVELLLLDSAHIQEEDAKYKTKRHRREGRAMPDTQPLYTTKDAEAVLDRLEPVAYHRTVAVAEGVKAVWHDAGHMLGSGHLAVTAEGKKVVFSGDVGVPGRVILRDPEPFDQADVMICESTYGNRVHESLAFAEERLAEIINATLDRGGNVVIPSFAVGRTQTLLYFMRKLMEADRIPPVVTFVDSPMAIKATQILTKHAECYDAEAKALADAGLDPVGFEPLHFSSTTSSSKAINRVRGCVIISASGMCTAGRIKHHLAHNIVSTRNTILFVGYQAQHTLGRQILEGKDPVRILGEERPVRAHIEKINGLSGHADKEMLLDWLGCLDNPPKQLFLTHGDEQVALEFAETIKERLGWAAAVPEYGETVTV